MDKIQENLGEAQRIADSVENILYTTFQILNSKKLLLRMLEEIRISLGKAINGVLQYEYVKGNIRLDIDPKVNMQTFREKCCPKYGINKREISQIEEVFNLAKKHETSPMEFVRDKKIIIMSKDLQHESLDLEKTKEFLQLLKDLLQKIKKKWKN
jgi:hypothetical protein